MKKNYERGQSITNNTIKNFFQNVFFSQELKIFRGQMIGRVKLSQRPFVLSFEWTVEDLDSPFNEKTNILMLTPSNKKNAILRIGLRFHCKFCIVHNLWIMPTLLKVT